MTATPQDPQDPKEDGAVHIDVPDTAKEAVSSSEEAKKEDAKESEFDAQPTQKAELKNYLRILSFGTGLDHVLLLVGLLTSIAVGITLPLMNIVFGRLVGDFTAYFIPSSKVTKAQFLKSTEKSALLIVYLFIARFTCSYITMFAFRIAGIRISAAIRLAYLRALFGQSISFMDKLPAGTATSRITNSANTLQLGISEKIGALVQGLTLLIGAYIIAFVYSWKMTLVASSVLPFVAVVYSITVPIQIKCTRSIEFAEEKASSLAGEIFGSIRTVVAFGGELRLGNKYGAWVTEIRRRGLKLAPLIGAQFAPLFFGIYADFGLSFWYGVKLYDQRKISSVSTVIV
jgi:ATP-binding cassette subfamily B (MDR/TAP) protein 1